MEGLSEAFYVFLVSSVIACLGVSIRAIYKSKCVRFSFCGINVERDIRAEEELDFRSIHQDETKSEKS